MTTTDHGRPSAADAHDARLTTPDFGWSEPQLVALLLLAHTAIWTIFATLTHTVVHHDMAEAWAWGQEWQLGYYKHPPFFAWMAGAWFSVFPRQSWAFFLLSEANAAMGLLGAWALARRLLPPPNALAVLALLALTPLYNLAAMKFNANTALLSLWPWTTYAFVRAIETCKPCDLDEGARGQGAAWGALLGLLAAACVLTKYYSGLLLLAIFAAAVLHPQARAYFRSASPYVTVLVGALAIAPHLAWLAGSGFPTLEYAAATTRHPTLAILGRGLSALAQAVAIHIIPALMLLAVLGETARGGMWRRGLSGLGDPSRRWIAVLAFGPLLLTRVALVLANVRISAQFMIPIFFMVPTAVLALSADRLDVAGVRRLARPVLLFALLALPAAPVFALVYMKSNATIAAEPRAALGEAVQRLWREAYGRRLAIVAGDETLSQAVSFYAPDRPSDFTAFSLRNAPWITPERLAASGFAAVCKAGQEACVAAAAPLLREGHRRVEVELTPRLLWLAGTPRHYVVLLSPPSGR